MKSKKCYRGRTKGRRMYPAILLSGLDLPSYLGEKSSIVVTEIQPQRALSKAKILLEKGQITTAFLFLWGAQPRETGDLDTISSWKKLYKWENLKTRHPAPLMFSWHLGTQVPWSFPKQPLSELKALVRRWVNAAQELSQHMPPKGKQSLIIFYSSAAN